MVMSHKHFLFAILQLFGALFLRIHVQAQEQAGFISIDCGASDSSYTDEKTNITYFSDTSFTESGESKNVLATYKSKTDQQQFWDLRSFPEGTRNCYTLKPSGEKGTRYLIRARFMYGNYDNKDQTPAFDLHIGVNFWTRVNISSAEGIVTEEIMHVPSSKRVHVCLVNTGSGVPFVSVIELRPIIYSNVYESPIRTALLLYQRYDFGSDTSRSNMARYKDDVYDRLWSPLEAENWTPLNTTLTEKNISQNVFVVPFAVMRTAYTQDGNMGIFWDHLNTSSRYFFFVHIVELEKLEINQTREFDIYMLGQLWSNQPIRPNYIAHTIYSISGTLPNDKGKIDIWFNSTRNATLPPLINALEVYRLQNDDSDPETYETEVTAMLQIKADYEIKIVNWQGDPCSPQDYLWDGLNCSYKENLPSRIISLNLSSRGIKGEISPQIANLKMLQYLDLSNNSLSGIVPEFLADLTFLTVLKLKGNDLEGSIPPKLIERSKNGLSLSVDDDLLGNEASPSPSSSNDTSSSPGFSPGKNKFVVPVVASFWGFFISFVL